MLKESTAMEKSSIQENFYIHNTSKGKVSSQPVQRYELCKDMTHKVRRR